MFEKAKEALRIEADSILELDSPGWMRISGQALDMILHCKGGSSLRGMGKSGIIARKIAATLAQHRYSRLLSPSGGRHPWGPGHGHGTRCGPGPFNSGETGEVLNILPSVRRIGARIVPWWAIRNPPLAKNADIVLNVGVKREACPLGLAPTSSTTALAYGMPRPWNPPLRPKITLKNLPFHPGAAWGFETVVDRG